MYDTVRLEVGTRTKILRLPVETVATRATLFLGILSTSV